MKIMENDEKFALGKKASGKRLQFCTFKLECLLETAIAVNECSNVDEILKTFTNILHNQLEIGKILLFNYNERWSTIIISGVSKNVADEIKLPDDLIYYKQITHLTNALNKHLTVFDVLIPVISNNQPIAYLLIGDVDEEREGISPTIKHLHFIQTLANIIITAIENRRLFNENLFQEGIKKELDYARRMQMMLIPSYSELPNNEHIKAASYYLPHFEVGGDYYDMIQLSEYEYGFCVADVSGKGISAALLMSNFQANIRALFTSNSSLDDIVQKSNQRVIKNTNGEKFITLFIGKYDFRTKILSYINAGHNYPILYNKSDGTVKHLQKGCTGIGMLDIIPNLTIGETTVTDGSRLVLYTDGISELENEQEDYYGTDKMESEVVQTHSIDIVVDNLVEDMIKYKGTCPYPDDITLLILEFRT